MDGERKEREKRGNREGKAIEKREKREKKKREKRLKRERREMKRKNSKIIIKWRDIISGIKLSKKMLNVKQNLAAKESLKN